MNRTAYLHPLFSRSSKFGVNVLATDRKDVIERFFDPALRESRFDKIDWHQHLDGVPVIDHCQASLICEISDRLEHTSHTILIGKVIDVDVLEQVSPLLYVDGALAQHDSHKSMTSADV